MIVPNTIQVVCTPLITTLATDTTLAASGLQTATGTIYIPENITRTFTSVRLQAYTRTSVTAGSTQFTGVRMGLKLGAAARVDVDRVTNFATTANRNNVLMVDLDVTSNFNTNFGSGTSQTFEVAAAFSTAVAQNVGCLSWKLIIAYTFETVGQATRIKTLRIPMQSDTTVMALTHSEVGTTGTTAAPANQWPILDNLPEASKTFRQIVLQTEFCDGDVASTATITPYCQIDATPEVARAPINNTFFKPKVIIDHQDLTGSHATSAAHSVNWRADIAGLLIWMAPELIVTYEYDETSTTQVMCEAMIPFTAPNSDSLSLQNAGTSAVSAAIGNATPWVADFFIPEANPTIYQSAAILDVISNSIQQTIQLRAGSQSLRSYQTGISGSAVTGSEPLHHRVDHSSGLTLSRGRNKLVLDVVAGTAGVSPRYLATGYLLLNYVADKPSDSALATHVINHFASAFTTPLSSETVTLPVMPSLSTYSISGVIVEDITHCSGTQSLLAIEQLSGEMAEAGFTSIQLFNASVTHANSQRSLLGATRLFRKHDYDLSSDLLSPADARRQSHYNTTGAAVHNSWNWWVTLHACRFTVSGTVSIGGSPVAAGKTVQIWAYDGVGNAELVNTVTTNGSGVFTTQVADSTRNHFATYDNDGNLSRSANGTPGTSSFNITIASGGGDATPPVVTTISLPATSFAPLIVSVYDAVGLSFYEVTVRDRADGMRLVAYDPTDGFVHPFTGNSSVTGSGTFASPYVFTIYRSGGWPSGISIDARVRAVDTSGNGVIA